LRVHASRRRPRFQVTADGRGTTGRSGTALLAEVADTIGLTSGLEGTVNGCRSWSDHAPGKVVRDLLVMLADGGDALRHLKVLGGEDQRVADLAVPEMDQSVGPEVLRVCDVFDAVVVDVGKEVHRKAEPDQGQQSHNPDRWAPASGVEVGHRLAKSRSGDWTPWLR